MMWTLKSLSSVPSKTVRPTPTMPGLISSTGMSVVAAGRDVPSRAARTAAIRNFMSLLEKPGRSLSYKEQLVAGQGERCYGSTPS